MNATIERLTDAELREALLAKTETLHTYYVQAGPTIDLIQVEGLQGDTKQRTETLRAMEKELKEYKAALDVRMKDDKAKNRLAMSKDWIDKLHDEMNEPDGNQPRGDAPRMGIGDLFVQSEAYKTASSRNMRTWPVIEDLDFDVKAAVFQTGAGFEPENVRIGRVIDSAQPRIAMVDVVPTAPTTSDAIRYMEETTYTDTNVVEKAEQTAHVQGSSGADVAGEAALAYTERTRTVEWIPVFLPATMQQIDDVPGIQERLNRRLSRMIRSRLSTQILKGNGTSPNLLGTNSVSGITTEAKGATQPVPDLVHELITEVRANGDDQEPDVAIFHPNDWHEIRTLRTSDGIYLWGPPSTPGPNTIWGLPVVVTAETDEGTCFVGDYEGYSELYIRRGITLAVSDSHGYMFTRGQLAIRADMRAAMVHYRGKAFAKGTGI